MTDIEMMVAAGWSYTYHQSDIVNKRIPPHGTPNHDVSYRKENVHVWKCKASDSHIGWQVAELIDGFYCNHRGKRAANHEPYRGDRFINGFIPDLKTVLELDAKGEL